MGGVLRSGISGLNVEGSVAERKVRSGGRSEQRKLGTRRDFKMENS